jgi:lycopene beta-cyclase
MCICSLRVGCDDALQETRSFFNAFFSLSAFHWHGFLSARLGFTQLIGE